MKRLGDSEHLFRVAGVFIVGAVLFLAFRAWSVPKSFGEYGHYRADFIKEEAARPIKFAGRESCEGCHPDVAQVKRTGKHAAIGCEACHGPLQRHAEDPASTKPVLPNVVPLCAGCHEANTARPHWFPQVAISEHSQGLACNTCHQPHSPRVQDTTKQLPTRAATR